ncbi:YtxH domain-containing protein [Actinoallomurus sp. NPDC052274]|uniref:YtxH domain-containing protein n=1 Tax=Actinoallomurus sp. NPDC052274 TaxID=3155420 RepID=UPI00341F9CBC
MKHRAVFLAGAATGYVLGTRAGKERYEQIKRMSRRVAEHPTVQQAAGVLRAQAGEIAESARHRFGDKVQTVSGMVQEKVPGMRRAEPSAPTEAADRTRQPAHPGDTPADVT